MKQWCRAISLMGVMLAGAAAAPAQTPSSRVSLDLAKLSIEDLMNVEVVSAARKEQRLEDVAAAAYVVTQDDIRRSGMTTVAEILRLVPGVQVARINSNKWAVSVRGFNGLFSNKLLVLVDGRTVYDPLFSGVFWESLDVPLDLVDRVEVIRGPGGATWGANAVNGVVNIVTKAAGATVGDAVTLSAGTFDGIRGAAQYGAVAGNLAYRVYSQWSGQGASRLDSGTAADDPWQIQTHGLRIDWGRGHDAVMVQAGASLGTFRGLWPWNTGPVPANQPPAIEVVDTSDYSALARWTRKGAHGSSLEVQSFVNARHNADGVNPHELIADFDVRYNRRAARRHDLVVGGGYRTERVRTDGEFAFSVEPHVIKGQVFNAFGEDEIALGSRLTATVGAKVEHNEYGGWVLQPTVRTMWTVVPDRQHLWASVSRARRTPALGEVLGRYNYESFVSPEGLPVLVGALGNRDLAPENVVDGEAGYRLQLGHSFSLDASAFVARYTQLRTAEPLAPRIEYTPAPVHLFVPLGFANLLDATTRGVEAMARWSPVTWWRVEGGYSTFHLTPRLSPESRDTVAAAMDGNAANQWQTRTVLWVGPRVELDGMLFHSGALRVANVDAYSRADVRVSVPVTSALTLSVIGQNLLEPRHVEFGGLDAIVTTTEIPRNVRLQVRWRF